MGTYQWVSARQDGYGGGPTPPDQIWHTPLGFAVCAVSVPSPHGFGDVLVRTEVAAWIGAGYNANITSSNAAASLQTWLQGDVDPAAGVIHDPMQVGSIDFAFSAMMDWQSVTWTYGSPLNDTGETLRASTRGYITSKARRGPDKYLEGHPTFNLGVFTDNSSNINTGIVGVATYWGFHVKCLWYTP